MLLVSTTLLFDSISGSIVIINIIYCLFIKSISIFYKYIIINLEDFIKKIDDIEQLRFIGSNKKNIKYKIII
jgi:hypothetical protein